MFRRHTLFILGAGASCEVGLPTGAELTKIIAKKLTVGHDRHRGYSAPNSELAESFPWIVQGAPSPKEEAQKYYEAANRISEALPLEPSIDQFIDNHGGDKYIELCGKLAIVHSILEAENRSEIFTDFEKNEYTPKYGKIENTWYTAFIHNLCTDCHIDQLETLFDNVAFIVFNYDRCLEHILYHALQSKYGIGDGHAADILSKLKIFHPYGTVGKLGWQDQEPLNPFGNKATPSGLISLTNEIKTFTERVENRQSIDEMRGLVDWAENIVFLGFAFYPQNINLITPETNHGVKNIYSSTFGLSNSFREENRQKLRGSFTKGGGIVNTKPNAKCFDVFQEYGRIFCE